METWPVLRGSGLVLAPTVPGDALELAACTDEGAFVYFPYRPDLRSEDGLARFIAVPTVKPYTLRLKTGQVVGCSSFFDHKPDHRALEIGYTWIAPEFRGTLVNPEAKLLMLDHAFEALGCVRVQLKCDARNAPSAAAIRKLGASYEGRLRNFGIMPDGFVRDALMFSILDREWPEVREGLLRRLDRPT